MEFDWGIFFSLFSVGAFWLGRAHYRHCRPVHCLLVYWPDIRFSFCFALSSITLLVKRGSRRTLYFGFAAAPAADMVLLVFIYNLPQLLFPPHSRCSTSHSVYRQAAGGIDDGVDRSSLWPIHHMTACFLVGLKRAKTKRAYISSLALSGHSAAIIIPQAFVSPAHALINEYITIIKLSSFCQLFRCRNCC